MTYSQPSKKAERIQDGVYIIFNEVNNVLMKACPRCKSNMIIKIAYDDLAEVEPTKPEFKCKSCGYEFGGLDKFLNDEFINDDLQLIYDNFIPFELS